VSDAGKLVVPKPPASIEDAAEWLAWLIPATASGQVDPKTAHELSTALGQFRHAVVQRDLAAEVRRLKREVESLKAAAPARRNARRAVED
jgi:hypothetical protein